jgi:GDP/UDP-N,N'-diacetylbacillosamine 2-epimerase (hydrolysing)
MKRTIAVVTGSRAEYGLLRPLMELIQRSDNLSLQVVVTGMHLSPEFGLTYREIEKDGFVIDERCEMLLSSDDPVAVSKSISLGITGLTESFRRGRPDLVLVLGDRFEIFSAATAAHVLRIPVVHLYGGEVTAGAYDDAFRHAITKMSYLHFTSCEEYRKRVIQLGEDPERVYNVGALGLDSIRTLRLLTKNYLKKDPGISFGERNLLVTFHPVTLEKETSRTHFGNLIEVLGELENTTIIFTKANADPEGRMINGMIDRFVAAHRKTSFAFVSLGQLRYLSVMSHVDGVVGNSSSGIIEAPAFRIGTVNIGDRQKGRVRAESVIDCDSNPGAIRKAIRRLYSPAFQRRLQKVVNPFGDGHAAERMLGILEDLDLAGVLKKGFYDVDFGH